MIICKKKLVALGKGNVIQYIFFEHKRLFSIIFYRWYTIDQIRFHTHAFNSIVFLLTGWYHEKVMFKGKVMSNFVNVPLIPRWLPKNYCHAIENAKPGSLTMVITGPWQDHWYECFPDSIAGDDWVKYTWGRIKIGKSKKLPKELLE